MTGCVEKLLMLAGLASAFAASAGEFPGLTGTDFSAYLAGESDRTFLTGRDDSGSSSGETCWLARGVNGARDDGYMGSKVCRIGSDNSVLDLVGEPGASVFRTLLPFEQGVTEPERVKIDAGLYLDTVMTFSPLAVESESVSAPVPQDVKIAVWLRSLVRDGAVETNLMVSAGYLKMGAADWRACRREHYAMQVPEGTDWSQPHRLTVRAIDGVNRLETCPWPIVGFLVYLDGELLGYPTDVAAGAPDSALAHLNAAALPYYNETVHQLVPSFVQSGTAYDTLSMAGFSAPSDIGEVYFSSGTNAPAFAADDVLVTLKWAAGVTGFDVVLDDATVVRSFTGLSDAGEADVTLSVGTRNVAIANAAFAADWRSGDWTAAGAEVVKDAETGASVGFSSICPGAVCQITAVSDAGVYAVGPAVFDNLDAAMEAAVGGDLATAGTIRLLGDAVVGEDEGYDGQFSVPEGVEGAPSVVLDLAGRALDGTCAYGATIGAYAGNLVITNSTPAVGEVLDSDGLGSLDVGDPDSLVICGGRFRAVDLKIPELTPNMTIFGGEFLTGQVELLEPFLGRGLVFEEIAGSEFSRVVPVTSYTLTVTAEEGVENVCYRIAGGEWIPYADPVEVTPGAAFEVGGEQLGYTVATQKIDEVWRSATVELTKALTNYKIVYRLNGGTVAGENPTSYTIQSEPITFVNPTFGDYEFLGWTGPELEGPTLEVTIPTGSVGDREYVANWKSANEWEDVEKFQIDMTGAKPEEVEVTLNALKDILGSVDAVSAWLTKVYGDATVPAAKVVAAKNLEISVAYGLPLMTAETPTVAFCAGGADGFAFQVRDGDEAVSLAAADLMKMVEFTPSLGTPFAPATEDDVAVAAEGTLATLTFVQATPSGFARIKLKGGAE